MFLSKARQSDDWVRNLRWRLELQNCLTIKGEGKGGGLALFWDEGLTVDLQSMGEHHIDVLVKDVGSVWQWRGSFIYGEPRAQDRHLMWDLMR